jgi:AAA+ superfamily predicted ATPase
MARLVSRDFGLKKLGELLEARVEAGAQPVEFSYELVFQEPPGLFLPPARLYFGMGSLESERPSIHVVRSSLVPMEGTMLSPEVSPEGVEVLKPVSAEGKEAEEEIVPIEDLILEGEVKEAVSGFIQRALSYLKDKKAGPPNLLLYGPDGSGKEALAKSIAAKLKSETNASFSIYRGTDPLFQNPAYQDIVEGPILVILDADRVEQRRWFASFVNRMRWQVREKPVLIFTGSSLAALKEGDSNIVSAGGFEDLRLSRPSEQQVRKYLEKRRLRVPDWVVQELKGARWRDIVEFCDRLVLGGGGRGEEFYRAELERIRSREPDWERLAGALEFEEAKQLFPESIMDQLESLISAANANSMLGVAFRKVVFEGPEGAGKSELAASFAKRLRARSFRAIDSSIFSSAQGLLVGQAESRIVESFADANSRTPSVVLIEDVDLLLNSQTLYSDLYSRVLLTLKEQVEHSGDGVYIVVTCQSFSNLNRELRSTLGEDILVLPVSLPDPQRRKKILEYYAEKFNAELKEGLSEGYSGELTEGWTLKDLESMMRLAVLNARKSGRRTVDASDLSVAHAVIQGRRMRRVE